MSMQRSRILWLSDIHYKHDDINIVQTKDVTIKNNRERIDKFFESLEKKIRLFSPTHILISGDLTFHGEYEQFVGLYNKLLKKCLISQEIRFIPIVGNHDVNRSYIEEQINSNKIKDRDVTNYKARRKYHDKNSSILEAGMFNNYHRFFENYVMPRFNLQAELEVMYSDRSTYGIIYDRKYKIFFISINSAWYSWGEKSFNEKLEIDFREQGNLTYGDKSIKKIVDTLKEYDSVLGESLVITQAHHGLSWISHEELYSGKYISDLFAKSDLVLNGHIHVPHNLPNRYREKTLIFEANQILDFKMYEFMQDEDLFATGKTIGFSFFEFSGDLSEGKQEKYIIKNFDNSNKSPFLSHSLSNFYWVKENNSPDFHFNLPKKLVLTFFDIVKDVYKYLNTLKFDLKSKGVFPLRNSSDCFLDIEKLNETLLDNNTYEIFDNLYLFSSSDSKKFSFFLDLEEEKLKYKNLKDVLVEKISSTVKSNTKIMHLDFILFDFQLIHIFKYEHRETNNFDKIRQMFDYFFKIIKTDFFTPSSKCKNMILGYRILTLVEYKRFITNNKTN